MTLAAELLCVAAIAIGLWLVVRDITSNFKKRRYPQN
jgi:hypothetical protein